MKKFLQWLGLKNILHEREHVPPLFKENEIWWCHVGENVGIEINGKSDVFTRPVLIFRKYDKYSFLGLPLSTKIKTGSWYSIIRFKERQQTIVLSQGRVFDYRRLKEKMGVLKGNQVVIVREGYKSLHIK